MIQVRYPRPTVTSSDAVRFARELYGVDGTATPLPSERDQNFHVTSTTGESFVLKIANVAESRAALEAQNRVLRHLSRLEPELTAPRVVAATSGEDVSKVVGSDGQDHLVRMLTFVDGGVWAGAQSHSPELRRSLGRAVALVDRALVGFPAPEREQDFKWDLTRAGWIREYVHHLAPPQRGLVERLFARYESDAKPVFSRLRAGLLYNDANDYNVIVRDGRVIGLIDYGDMTPGPLVCDLAIAIAYGIMGAANPLAAAADIVAGYHEVLPLTDAEFDVLYALVCARLCVSVTNSAYQRHAEPANEYLLISERPAWDLLEKLGDVDPGVARETFRIRCGLSSRPAVSAAEILAIRRTYLGRNLSLAYDTPLHIVRGYMQHLYDADGRAYLDAVNNVAHVGHCHPRVVRAGQAQMAVLNTNTRYLHELVVRYAERLCATLPEPLRVCYFVNSGSEANELALRLARTHTRSQATVVLDGAYHGNTSALVEISPYKYDGPGGTGQWPFVRKVARPDPYRGAYRRGDPKAGVKYAALVERAVGDLRSSGHPRSTFVAESAMGSSGQVILPDGFLEAAYRHIRADGGVCIADEVQVGLGRVGTHFWGFQTQNVVPDIVAVGKPIGNGHPLGAVITTPELAESFNNGMEYFNTFGGNPVSCAIGLAVLDVIEDERLQANALRVGERLRKGFRELASRHALIGDVRGLGLFVGVELVNDRTTLAPAPGQTAYVTNRLVQRGVLVSIDGPLHNVLKIKPPLVFSDADADFFVETLDAILKEDAAQPSPAR
jgi:4-aminobutyrate aminotransferase-like enzyme/Ser/Thr protein kinase RdoA (MazF antagonist)